MIVYKDILTGDEVVSDQYDLIDVNDTVYEVNCKRINIEKTEFEFGAQLDDEDVNDHGDSRQVIDVVDKFRLQYLGDEASERRYFATKKDYATQLKAYVPRLVQKLRAAGKSEDDIKTIQDEMQRYFTRVISPNFKDFDFYSGESMDPVGMVILLNYRDDGVTPYLTFWKHGLVASTTN